MQRNKPTMCLTNCREDKTKCVMNDGESKQTPWNDGVKHKQINATRMTEKVTS